MNTNKVDFRTKHEYYNSIYDDLHPQNDRYTRVYNKPRADFNFKFKDNTLNFFNNKDLNFNKKSMEKFKFFKESDLDINEKSIQKRISYYLTNNIVPGLIDRPCGEFKKEKLFQSMEVSLPSSYNVDKWYFMKKDELNAYYEKFFNDKEVEKMRKKNQQEAGIQPPNPIDTKK